MTIIAETILRDVFTFRLILHSDNIPLTTARRCLQTLWEEYIKMYAKTIVWEDEKELNELTLKEMTANKNFRDAEAVAVFDVLLACTHEAAIAYAKFPEFKKVRAELCKECSNYHTCDHHRCDAQGVDLYEKKE